MKTMKMSDILEVENLIPDLKARDKKRAIEELADAVVKTNPSLDKDSLIRVLLDRESLGSTAIGDGVAIPHGKFPGINPRSVKQTRSCSNSTDSRRRGSISS